jgi:hypothetical protein
MNKAHPTIGRKNHQPIDKLGAITLSATRSTPWGVLHIEARQPMHSVVLVRDGPH